MAGYDKYRSRYTGVEVEDLLGRVPTVEQRVTQLEAGGGDKTFVYETNNSSDVWEIEHNLGKYPSVTVVEYYSKEEVIVDVEYIDKNNLKVKFKNNLKGIAYLN